MHTPIRLLIFLLLLTCPLLAQPDAQPAEDTTGAALALEQSRAAARDLNLSLRQMLAKHLTTGGAARAIAVCADSAQVVSGQIQDRHQLTMRRVSSKWRNTRNTPDAFESAHLKKMQEMREEGTLTDTLEIFAVIGTDSARTFRYMRPILIGEMCLGCHGDAAKMKEPVREALQRRYPSDKATGYRAGDFRGAVSVSKLLR